MDLYDELVRTRIFNGYKVLIDKSGGKPAKPHIKNENMSEAYHKRISKKWLKRFGLTPPFIQDGQIIKDTKQNCLHMNESTWQQVLNSAKGDT